jgi:hypothetical protein
VFCKRGGFTTADSACSVLLYVYRCSAGERLAGYMPARASRMLALPFRRVDRRVVLRTHVSVTQGARAFCSPKPACCWLADTVETTSQTLSAIGPKTAVAQNRNRKVSLPLTYRSVF